jgi:hypothetical protein
MGVADNRGPEMQAAYDERLAFYERLGRSLAKGSEIVTWTFFGVVSAISTILFVLAVYFERGVIAREHVTARSFLLLDSTVPRAQPDQPTTDMGNIFAWASPTTPPHTTQPLGSIPELLTSALSPALETPHSTRQTMLATNQGLNLPYLILSQDRRRKCPHSP